MQTPWSMLPGTSPMRYSQIVPPTAGTPSRVMSKFMTINRAASSSANRVGAFFRAEAAPCSLAAMRGNGPTIPEAIPIFQNRAGDVLIDRLGACLSFILGICGDLGRQTAELTADMAAALVRSAAGSLKASDARSERGKSLARRMIVMIWSTVILVLILFTAGRLTTDVRWPRAWNGPRQRRS